MAKTASPGDTLREKIRLLRAALEREANPTRRRHIEYEIRACEVALKELETL